MIGYDHGMEEEVSFISEQLVAIATIIATIAALPTLLEFIIESRKRKQKVALSIEDVSVENINVNLAGVDDLLLSIQDLIDRAKSPRAYNDIKLGNEILVVGPVLSGKKSLAQKIAQLAEFDRIITVYNARNPDALIHAKELVSKADDEKVLLLLPRIDLVYEEEGEEVLSELDALIETSSGQHNVLVVGTAVYFEPDNALDNQFGIKLVLPGYEGMYTSKTPPSADLTKMLTDVVKFYLDKIVKEGFSFQGISAQDALQQILASVSNPAEVEDIVVLCQTSAIYSAKISKEGKKVITPEILERAIDRVVVSIAHPPPSR